MSESECHPDRALLPTCTSDAKVSPGKNRQTPRLVVVEPYLFFYLVSGVPMEAIFTQYFYRKVGYSMGIDVDNLTSLVNSSFSDCGTDINDTNYLLREQVQAATSQWTLYISLAGFFPYLLAFIFYGSMSDRMGRRMCFILPPIGCIIRSTIQTLAIYFQWPVWAFFFINVELLFGSYELVVIGCYSYIADTTRQRHLALRMTIIHVLDLATDGFSDLGIGYMIKSMGYFWPMLFVIGGKLLALVYAIVFIPETISNTGNAKRFDVTDFTRALKLITHDNGTGRRWKIILLFFSIFLSCIVDSESLWSLVEMNAPLCWDSVLIGYFTAFIMAITGIGSMVGAKLKRWFAEEWIIVLSQISGVLENAYIPFVRTTAMMFMAPILGIFLKVSTPMKKAILSDYVAQNEQGALFAGMSTMDHLGTVVGLIVTNNIYSATILLIQGRIVFIIAATIGLLSTLIVLIFTFKTKEDRSSRLEREKQLAEVVEREDGNIEA